jgi:ABC-type uncharacterized transport system permease subunit
MRSDALRRGLAALAVSTAVAALALALSLLIIALTGSPAGEALQALWDGAFGSKGQLASTLAEMLPLTLVALGWCVAFSARRVNVGLEGQILVGGVAAAVVGLELDLPAALHLPLAVLAGVAGGALYAGIAAWLWARYDVNDIIGTLMLNFIAIQLVSWLVRGPLQEPAKSFAQTGPIDGSARWPNLLPHTVLTWDIVLVPVAVALVWVLLRRTPFGFALRLTGANSEAARAAGISTRRVGVAALVISGGLAGLAGGSLLLGGESSVMTDNFSGSRGFEGIAVALLARNSPVACIPAALLFAVLQQGGGLMEARVGVPSSLVEITQGLVIVLVAASGFLLARRRAVRREQPTPTTAELAAGAPEVA